MTAGQTQANCFDGTTRTPWNNTIYPGNYVCHLNSYRNQGVNAYPGLQFFSLVGALVILPIENVNSNVLTNGLLVEGNYFPQILSPDLGPSPKPLANRPFKLPIGAVIYSSAVSTVNLEESTGGAVADAITVTGPDAALQAKLGSDSNGTFNECGARVIDLDFSSLTAEATETTIGLTIKAGTDLKPVNITSGGSGSAFADPTAGQSAIIVEVDYFMPAKGPDSDAINLPYPYSAESTGF